MPVYFRIPASLLLAGMLALFIPACSPSKDAGPKTYPVKGKVVDQQGKPFGKGMIEFRAQAASLNAFGEIQEDGSFTLHTMADTAKLGGAPEGEYQVTLVPPQSADRTTAKGPPPRPIILPTPYRVKQEDNDFTVKFVRPKR